MNSNVTSFKNMRRLLVSFLLIVCVSTFLFPEMSFAGMPNATTAMSFEDNIASPPVLARRNGEVSRHIRTILKKFEEKGFATKAVRNNEVGLITIPASDLFLPNETSLKENAEQILSYFKQAINHPDSYRILVAVYADDSGDEPYSLKLTKDRAESIRKTFARIASSDIASPNIDYYWFGNSRFIAPNNNMTNRAKNRRVEIYIIPERRIVED